MCVYTVLYGITQWLEAGRGMSPREAGLLLLPMSGLSALLAQPISQRNLVRLPLLAAAVASLAASAGVLLLTTSTPIIWIVLITLGFGVTLGAMVSANQTTLYHQVDPDQIGTASGLFKTFGSIGSIASSALIAVTFHTSVSDSHLHVIALIMVIVSAAGLLLVVADRQIMAQARVGDIRGASNPAPEQHAEAVPGAEATIRSGDPTPVAASEGRSSPMTDKNCRLEAAEAALAAGEYDQATAAALVSLAASTDHLARTSDELVDAFARYLVLGGYAPPQRAPDGR